MTHPFSQLLESSNYQSSCGWLRCVEVDDSDGFVVAAAVMIDTLTGVRKTNDLRNISFTYLVLYNWSPKQSCDFVESHFCQLIFLNLNVSTT